MGCGGSKNQQGQTKDQHTEVKRVNTAKAAEVLRNSGKEDLTEVPATPSFVVKLSSSGEDTAQKVFINVYYDSRLSRGYADQRKGSCLDRKGNESILFNVCYPSDLVVGPDCKSKSEIAISAIKDVRVAFGNQFSVNTDTFSLPAIVKGFMGDDVCVFKVPTSYIVNIQSPEPGTSSKGSDDGKENLSVNIASNVAPVHGTAAVHAETSSQSVPTIQAVAAAADFAGARDLDFHVIPSLESSAPSGGRFWTLFKDRSSSSGVHQRYVVIEAGMVKVYQWSVPTPPYGKDLKFEHSIGGYTAQSQFDGTDHIVILAGPNASGIEFRFDTEIAKNHVLDIIKSQIKFYTAHVAKESAPVHASALNATAGVASTAAPVEHKTVDDSADDGSPEFVIDTEDYHPEVIAAAPTTHHSHMLPMRCACSHRQGMCDAPLNTSFMHTFDCCWTCCGRIWSNHACNLTAEQVAERLKEPPTCLQFDGSKKGHFSTARQSRHFVVDRGELKYYASKLNVAPYGKDLKGSMKLRGYKVVTETDSLVIYLQPTLKGTKDLDIELEDHVSVRDYIANELTRHIELANELYSDEEVLTSPVRQSSISLGTSPLFKPRPGRAQGSKSTNNLLATEDEKASSPPPTTASSSPAPVNSSSPPLTADAVSTAPVASVDVEKTAPLATAKAETPSIPEDVSPPKPIEEESVDVSKPPPLLKFWAQKKGHVNVGMKARYFVVHGGKLDYYVNESDSPPFGTDLKGTIYLANYEIVDLSTQKSGQPNDLRVFIVNKLDNTKDMDLQFAVKALKQEVEEGLQRHIRYATACRRFDTDLEHSREFLDAPSPSASIADPASQRTESTTIKRTSTFSVFSSRSSVSAASNGPFPKPYVLSAEDRSKWSLFVPSGASLIATALVNKPNPVGKALMRQIVLTSDGKLIYIDAADNKVKGTIDVSAGRSLWPIAKMDTDTAFIIREAKGSREYKFIDTVYGSKFWVDTITSLPRK